MAASCGGGGLYAGRTWASYRQTGETNPHLPVQKNQVMQQQGEKKIGGEAETSIPLGTAYFNRIGLQGRVCVSEVPLLWLRHIVQLHCLGSIPHKTE